MNAQLREREPVADYEGIPQRSTPIPPNRAVLSRSARIRSIRAAPDHNLNAVEATPKLRSVMRALFAGLLALTLGCSEPEPPPNTPPTPCKVDGDCGSGRYCTEAHVCRRDCYIDAHCYGPTTSAQCNAQGKCIDTVDAASPPPEDAEPIEGGKPPDAESEGGA